MMCRHSSISPLILIIKIYKKEILKEKTKFARISTCAELKVTCLSTNTPPRHVRLAMLDSDNTRQSVRNIPDFFLFFFSESAAAKEKEEAEHGNQSDRLKRRDQTPNDIVHYREAEAAQTGPVEDRGGNKVRPSEWNEVRGYPPKC